MHDEAAILHGAVPEMNRPPRSPFERMLGGLLLHLWIHIALGPLILFFGAVFLVGVIGMIDLIRGNPRGLAQLWYVFPGSLAVLALAGYLYWRERQNALRTIQEFWLDESSFEFAIPRQEQTTVRPLRELDRVEPYCERRCAYPVYFRDGEWVLIPAGIRHAEPLVRALQSAITGTK